MLPKADPRLVAALSASPSRGAWAAMEPLCHIQLFSVISVSVIIDKLDRLICHFIFLFHLNLSPPRSRQESQIHLSHKLSKSKVDLSLVRWTWGPYVAQVALKLAL